MIINEIGLCPTTSNNVYFANNEQASLAFTGVFCFSHAEHNLTEFKLYIIIDQRKLLAIFPRVLWEIQSKPIKFIAFKH